MQLKAGCGLRSGSSREATLGQAKEKSSNNKDILAMELLQQEAGGSSLPPQVAAEAG